VRRSGRGHAASEDAGPAGGGPGGAASGGPPDEPLLEAGFLARLERLQLSTRRPLAGLYAGGHRSPRRGSSLDFAEHREYHPGDDFRRIDYHALARLGVLVLKLFDAEDDLPVRLVVDTSASMGFDGKLRAACRLAAVLGFVGLVRRDPVRVQTLDRSLPPVRFSGRGDAARLFDHLVGLTAGGTTDLAGVGSDLRARRGAPGMTVLVSDLLSPQWPVALTGLPPSGGDLVVAHVLAPTELEPNGLAGDADLVDSESGERVAVSLAGEQLEHYRTAMSAWRTEVAHSCRRAGVAYCPVIVGEPLEPLLFGAWQRAGIVR
jgi:uncharacterized protein (DUF58 family)